MKRKSQSTPEDKADGLPVFGQSQIDALEDQLNVERLRPESDVQQRIESTYFDWLAEESGRNDVRLSVMLDRVSERFAIQARGVERLELLALSGTSALNGSAPITLRSTISRCCMNWLEQEASRRGIGLRELLQDVANRFANREWNRKQRLLDSAAGTPAPRSRPRNVA